MHLFLGGWDLESRCAHYLIWYKIQLLYLNLFRHILQKLFLKNHSFYLASGFPKIFLICGFLQYTYSLHYAHFGSWKKIMLRDILVTGTIDSNNLNLWSSTYAKNSVSGNWYSGKCVMGAGNSCTKSNWNPKCIKKKNINSESISFYCGTYWNFLSKQILCFSSRWQTWLHDEQFS